MRTFDWRRRSPRRVGGGRNEARRGEQLSLGDERSRNGRLAIWSAVGAAAAVRRPRVLGIYTRVVGRLYGEMRRGTAATQVGGRGVGQVADHLLQRAQFAR